MKNIQHKAFTIAELIITTVILAIVCIVAPVITLKRQVKPSSAKNFDFIAECTNTNYGCFFDAHNSTLYVNGVPSKKLDYNKSSNEFYTIELVGGGGGGTSKSHGYRGETKIIYLPSLDGNQNITPSNANLKGILTGYYYLKVGKGGSANENGGLSKICIAQNLTDTSCTTEIAHAKGGIISNEETEYTGASEDEYKSTVASYTEGSNYGYGGSGNNRAGTQGTIVIK